jgi:sugar lactone lactonase YvrE
VLPHVRRIVHSSLRSRSPRTIRRHRTASLIGGPYGRGSDWVETSGDGFDFPGDEFAPGTLAIVSSDGTVRGVADGLAFPNGIAITSDERTLIVAESYAERLTAFAIDDDGGLRDRRVWAETPGDHPDGICVDADGAPWACVASEEIP